MTNVNEFLQNVAKYRFLDPSTLQLLDEQFIVEGEGFGEFSIKHFSKTYNSWCDLFSHVQANSPLSSIDGVQLTVSYFDVEDSRKRVLKGKLKFAKDQWGNYPITFTADNVGFYHNSAKGMTKIAVINSILSGNSSRRKMAKEYLASTI